MSLRGRVIKGGALLSADQAIKQFLRLVRNVIVARILLPEDFGIAATFWITTGFLSMISELGFGNLIVQAKEGDDERFGATIQLMILIRALLIGAIVFVLAEPVAAIFRAPETVWAFRLLAIVPALGGLRHLDMERLTRELRFGPAIASNLGPTIVTTALAWPIATYVGDYSAFVWLAIIQTALAVLMSHLLAKRRFLLQWDWAVVKRAFVFGWPLLLNSLLIYAVLQGDRIILARAYTKTQLGVYSIAFGLAMMPGMMAIGIGSRLLLPILSKMQDDLAKFTNFCRVISSGAAVVAGLIAILFIIMGPALISIIFGAKYAGAALLIGWLGAAHASRLLRLVPISASMAKGDTKTALLSNIFRQVGLGLALLVAVRGGSLVQIAMTGLAGEACAVTVAMIMLRRHGLGLMICGRSVLVFAGVLVVAIAIGSRDFVQESYLVAGIAFVLISASLAVVSWLLLPELRQPIRWTIVSAGDFLKKFKRRFSDDRVTAGQETSAPSRD